MIAWLRRSTPEHLEPHTLTQLADIARDHARLVADLEAHRSLSRNQIEQWQHELDTLRAELARIRAHIESSHNEVTCSQDARHANDGDDRVPMLTCMTWEAHTLRAENAKLRKGWDDECVQAQGYAEDAAKLRERLELLRTAACALVGEARALVWDEPPDRVIPTSLRVGSVRQLRAALAALDEEDGT